MILIIKAILSGKTESKIFLFILVPIIIILVHRIVLYLEYLHNSIVHSRKSSLKSFTIDPSSLENCAKTYRL